MSGSKYFVKNYIFGEFKESYSRENIEIEDIYMGNKSISMVNSIEADIGDAFLAANQIKDKIDNQDFKNLIKKIKEIGKNYLNDEAKLLLIAKNSGSPIKYIKESVNNVKNWMINIDKFLEMSLNLKNLDDHHCKNNLKVKFVPGGTTGVILAGDEVALSAYVLTQCLLARVPTVVKPSSIELISCNEFIKECDRIGLKGIIQMVCWSVKNRDLGKTFLQQCEQFVFFGNSDTYNSLILDCSDDGRVLRDHSKSIRTIAYTTGRSASIIMDDADLKLAVEEIINGASSNKGHECVTTKKVFLHEKIYDKVVNELVKNVKRLKFGDPLNDYVDVGVIDKNLIKNINKLIENENVIYKNIENGKMSLVIIDNPNRDSKIVKEEIPAPIIALLPFKEIYGCVEIANSSLDGKYSTTTSIFTKNKKHIELFHKYLNTHKIILNKSSTTMDLNLPHDGKYLVKELMKSKYLQF